MGAIATVASAAFGGFAAAGAAFSWSTFGLGLLPLLATEIGPAAQGPRLDNLDVGGSDYLRPIPHGYGTFSLAGNLIWAAPIKERAEKHGKFGQPKYTEYTYYGTFMQLFCAGPTSGKTMRLNRLWVVLGENETLLHEWNATLADQTGYQITYDGTTKVGTGTYQGDATAGEIIVYCGTDNQLPWEVAEEYEGAGNVPAYINRCCVGLVNYPLHESGGQIPTLRAEWVEGSTSIEDICDSIAERVATNIDLFVPATDCDFSALSGDALSSSGIEGFICDQPAPASQFLDQIRTAYKVDFPCIDDQVQAIKRGGASIITLTEDDLGWHAYGSETPPLIDDKIGSEAAIPRQFDVSFLDTDRDGKPSSQPVFRQTVLSEAKTTFSLGFYMHSTNAKAIGETNLAEAWVGRNVPTTSTSYEYMWLAPGDPITITRGSDTIPVLITDTHIRIFGPQDLSLIEYDPEIYTQSFTGEAAPLAPAKSVTRTAPVSVLFESNAADDGDCATPGFYIAATRPTTESWVPLRFQESTAITSLYTALFPSSIPRLSRATIGTATEALGDWALGSGTWDDTSTCQIDFDYGVLTSASEDDVLAGVNTLAFGAADRWEFLRFTDASYVGEFSGKRRYEIGGRLWRGLRGTEFAIGLHEIGDKVVLIDSAVERVDTNPLLLNVPRSWVFRDSASIEVKEPLDTIAHTVTGVSMKPFSPAFLTAVADGADIDITFEKRSRFEDVSLLTGVPPADAPYDVTVFKVDIYDGVTLVRTLSEVLTTTSITYAAADIATDGFTTGETITIAVSQQSSMVGWGYEATTTVLAP